MRKMERPRLKLALIFMSAAVGLAACSGDGPADAGAAPERVTNGEAEAEVAPLTPVAPAGDTIESPAATTNVAVYLIKGESLRRVDRTVAKVPRIGAEALKALLSGPTAAERRVGLATAIPGGTRLLGVAIEGGTATVDLSRSFESGGGTLGLTLRLAQVACTVDQFDTVTGVRFSLDGEVVRVFSGDGIVLDKPVSCASYRRYLDAGASPPGCQDIGTYQGCPTHGGPEPGSPEDCASNQPVGPCPGEGPGATLECQTVGFTPQSEDAASSVTATGLPCAEAEAFVRIVGRLTSAGGPQQVDAEGYRCVLVRTEEEPLPQAFYECTNGPKRVTFVRT
jgi:hypothetical protein